MFRQLQHGLLLIRYPLSPWRRNRIR